MDYSNLKDIYSLDSSELLEKRYFEVKESKNIIPVGKTELEKAKSILSIVSPKSNLSLYDHLCGILRKVLRYGITDAVDELEEISQTLKDDKRSPKSDIKEEELPDEIIMKFIKQRKEFYQLSSMILKTPDIKKSQDVEQVLKDEGEAKKEDEETEVDTKNEGLLDKEYFHVSPSLSDLHHRFNRFRLGGIGLDDSEVYELKIALRNLAMTQKLEKVKFWGKIFAINCNYYVAETPYQSNVQRESFGWEDDKKIANETPIRDDEILDEKSKTEESPQETLKLEEGKTREETTEEKVISPIPEPKLSFSEEDGTAINDHPYFVSTDIVGQWRCLPSLKPHHLRDAKRLKRLFTGDLEADVHGCVSFPGKEAHYLRAQIARISASTSIAPKDYFKIPEEKEIEDRTMQVQINKKYDAKSVKDLYSEGLDAWVHYKRAVLDQMDDDENQKEEEHDQEETEDTGDLDAEIFKGIKETKVPLLRSLSEDKAVGGLVPWTLKLSSQLMPESAILIVHSNIWPGAFTYYDGKSFERLYIGFGYKYSTYHYAPAMSLTQQNEFSESLVEPDDMEEKQKNEATKEKTLDKKYDEGIREMIEELMEGIEDDESEKDKVNEETGEERSNEFTGLVESDDMIEKQKDEADNEKTLDKNNEEDIREIIEELIEVIEDDESEDKENEETGYKERRNHFPGLVKSNMEAKQKDEAENEQTLDKSNDEGIREMIEELMELIEDDESEDKENEETGNEERNTSIYL